MKRSLSRLAPHGPVGIVAELRQRPQSHFQKSIIDKGLVPSGVDARHVEGFIRLQYSTLGHLDWATIRREVRLSVQCIRVGGVEAAERNALSFGL